MKKIEDYIKKYNYNIDSLEPENVIKRRAIVTELKLAGYKESDIKKIMKTKYTYSYFEKDKTSDKYPVNLIVEKKITNIKELYKLLTLTNILIETIENVENNILG